METMVHDKPRRRKMWAEHATKGWVLGKSPEHYRCWKIAMQKKHLTRISSIVLFKHKYSTNPAATPVNAIMAAAQDMAAQLRDHA